MIQNSLFLLHVAYSDLAVRLQKDKISKPTPTLSAEDGELWNSFPITSMASYDFQTTSDRILFKTQSVEVGDYTSLYEYFVPLTSALSPSPSHSSLISILMNPIPPLITLRMTAMRQGNDDGQLPMLEQQTKLEQWWWPLHALSSAIFHLSSALSSELCSCMRLEAQHKMMWNFLACTCEPKLTKESMVSDWSI